MSFPRIARTPPRADAPAAFRPALVQLEDRSTPASLLTLAASGAFLGANAPVQILGVSDDGQKILAQSTATNLVPGQVDVPDTNDLFYFNRTTGVTALVTARDPATAAQGTPGTQAIGALLSTPNVLNNAVISGDGSRVGFLSGANANQFNSFIPAIADDGGADMFVWTAATGKAVLASQDARGNALGSYASVDSPGLNADGTSGGFISTTSAWFSYDKKYVIDTASPPTPHPFGGRNVYRFSTASDVTKNADMPNIPSPVTSAFFPTPAGNFYRFFDAASVDPLGRYVSGTGVTFVAMNTGDVYGFGGFFFPGTPVTASTSKDAYRLTFAGTGGFNADPSTSLLSLTTDGYALGAEGLGTVGNAFLARDRADISVFTASSTGGTPSGGAYFSTNFNFGGTQADSTGALVAGYVNQNGGAPEVYRSVSNGIGTANTTALVSAVAGSSVTGSAGFSDPSPSAVRITPDGLKVVFTSTGADLVAGLTDGNRANDIFLKNFQNNTTTAVSVTNINRNRTGFGASRNPTVTPDGLLVAFESDANDLSTTPDPNAQTDVFVRDLNRQTTSLASAVPGNFNSATGTSNQAFIGGSFIAGQLVFASTATDLDNLNKGLTGTFPNVFTVQTPLTTNVSPRSLSYSGGAGGLISISQLDTAGNVLSTTTFRPFGNFGGEIRVATGDVNGDGTPDIIAGAGPGGGPRVQVIDGFTGRVIDDFFAFESRFTGGVYVGAGNFTPDGRADLIVGAGEGGGPRVQIYNEVTRTRILDQFAYESTSRTGVHVTAGDFNGDGRDDLFVGAGLGGGPRVRIFDGAALPGGLNTIADFFAGDETARSGVYISAGDFDGDGKADLITGSGPGVVTRVQVLNAANLSLQDPNQAVAFRDFLPYGPTNTEGARATLRNIVGGPNADIVVGNVTGSPRVNTYAGNSFGTSADTPQLISEFIPFGQVVGSTGANVG